MGTCCFTPKKTHFLWWYWLVLASVIGIPMLLAALYVKRRRARGYGPERAAYGAERLFWILSAGMVIVVSTVAFGGNVLFHAGYDTDPIVAEKRALTFHVFVLNFLVCFFLASIAVTPRASRLISNAVMFFCCVMWVLIEPFAILVHPLDSLVIFAFDGYLDYPNYSTSCLMFAACLPAAWGWWHFLHESTPRTARRALALLVLSCALFYGAAKYGNTAHLYAHRLARGHTPTAEEVDEYSMK